MILREQMEEVQAGQQTLEHRKADTIRALVTKNQSLGIHDYDQR